MKIAFYSPISINYGGGQENWFTGLSKNLIEEYNMKISLIDTDFAPVKRWSNKEVKKKLGKVKHYRIRTISKGGVMLPHPCNIKELTRICKKQDIIYFNPAFIFQDALLSIVKKLSKKPVICGIHAPLFFENKIHNIYTKIITKKLLKKFDAIHTLNEDDKKLIKKWGVKKIYLIPSGSDTEYFKIKKFKKSNKLRFLFVGRLSKQKGIDILVKAITFFLKENPKAKVEFNIVGSGELEYLVKKIKSKPKVNYLGYVKNIVKTYQQNNILIVPSRQETFGLIITEANSCGLPVISSKIPGPNKLIKNGKNGWFIKKLNPKELAKQIEIIYKEWSKNPGLIKTKGLYGRKFVEENYSLKNTAKGFEKMFKEVLKC